MDSRVRYCFEICSVAVADLQMHFHMMLYYSIPDTSVLQKIHGKIQGRISGGSTKTFEITHVFFDIILHELVKHLGK